VLSPLLTCPFSSRRCIFRCLVLVLVECHNHNTHVVHRLLVQDGFSGELFGSKLEVVVLAQLVSNKVYDLDLGDS